MTSTEPKLSGFEIGDFVTYGDNPLTWSVRAVHAPNDFNTERADIQSGQSNNWRHAVRTDRLKFHSKAPVLSDVIDLANDVEEQRRIALAESQGGLPPTIEPKVVIPSVEPASRGLFGRKG